MNEVEKCPEVRDGGSSDADGDGIADADDLCPAEAENHNGFQDGDGCDDLVPTELVDVSVLLAEPCFVGSGATLRPKTRRALGVYADLLAKHSDVKVEISAHSRGMRSAQRAYDLTQRRAEAVVDELVRLGVARERLVARGAGMDESYCCEAPCDGPQRLEVKLLRE
ncbi:OmpA family protein [Nannocystis sp. ILAH1]|uniref:OmpA family protein n=1 Tax=unclassified Nannocystis TaxID=2627009 RepID=UPI002270E8CD|nr:OmpA family protein [Nannocystis sp. ILAH1]MCY1067831.1 OmpA family protein [Nannocystis sp. RBIL2]